MNRTGMEQTAKLLMQAAQADPADARVPAYMALVRLADDKADEGFGDLRLATALEEARLRPRGVTAKQPGVAPCHPEMAELALLLMLAHSPGGMESKSGHADAALELAMNNLALERRIASGDMLRKLPTSVLPIVGAEVQNRQQPENAASLLAWSHYQAGVALRDGKSGDPKHFDNAAAQFQAAFMAGREHAEHHGNGAAHRTAPPRRLGAGPNPARSGQLASGPASARQGGRRSQLPRTL